MLTGLLLPIHTSDKVGWNDLRIQIQLPTSFVLRLYMHIIDLIRAAQKLKLPGSRVYISCENAWSQIKSSIFICSQLVNVHHHV